MRVSKETTIKYIVIVLVSAIPCYIGQVGWFVLFYYPCFYFILWTSLREADKHDKNKPINQK